MAKTPFDLKGRKVLVAGHRGMVGGALVRRLAQEDVELLTVERRDVDLRDQAAVASWFAAKRPQVIFLAVSCCRFDGRLVKLIPASVRTQQG
jgi:GDP-L-fucose synthase